MIRLTSSSIFVEYLDTVRFHCGQRECDTVIEMPLSQIPSAGFLRWGKRCPGCQQEIPFPDYLVKLAEAIKDIASAKNVYRIEFRLPEKQS
jgi:hypothetical protein